MHTLTIRNVPAPVVRALKVRARRNRRSMEQEVRDMLADHVADRRTALEDLRSLVAKQRRRPTSAEVDRWIADGRE